jgi:hypothetical protein
MAVSHLHSDDVLTAFLNWNDIGRQALSGNAHHSIYRRALHHPHHEIRSVAAQALREDVSAMATAAHDSHMSVRVVAARSAVTPPATIAKLARDRSISVRQTVASRTDLDEDTSYVMAGDSDVTVRLKIAAGPRTPLMLGLMLQDPNLSVQVAALTNPLLDPDDQLNLAYYGDEFQRVTLAGRSQLVNVLEVLANDHTPQVQLALISNPHTPISLVIALAERDRDHRSRLMKERHRDLPDDILRRYVEEFLALPDSSLRHWIRLTLPRHAPPNEIAQPPDPRDHHLLLEVVDRWLPYHLIAHAVGDSTLDSSIRRELLAHPDIPLSTLAGLMNSRSSVLREAASHQLRLALHKVHRASVTTPGSLRVVHT